MADEDAGIRLPATAPAYYFSELAEMLPTAVAYAHDGEFYWSLGHLHDNLRGLLPDEIQLEPFPKFCQIIGKKLNDSEVVRHLGVSMYMKPGIDRLGNRGQSYILFLCCFFCQLKHCQPYDIIMMSFESGWVQICWMQVQFPLEDLSTALSIWQKIPG